MEYIVNRQGKWLIQGNIKLLIEPSEEYKTQRALEEQQRLEEEILNSLKPSEEEVLKAETQLTVLEVLIELGVL